MCREIRGESGSGSLRVCGIRYCSGWRFLCEHALIANAPSHAFAIEIFKNRNDDAPGGREFFPELAGRRCAVRRNKIRNGSLHFVEKVFEQSDFLADLDNFALLDQKTKRLLITIIF